MQLLPISPPRQILGTPTPDPSPPQVGPARLAHDNAEPGQARVPGERERIEFEAPPSDETRPRRARSVTPIPLAPAVIPLVHAPDDPGPDPESQIEPEPAVEPLPDSWGRIRQLFKP